LPLVCVLFRGEMLCAGADADSIQFGCGSRWVPCWQPVLKPTPGDTQLAAHVSLGYRHMVKVLPDGTSASFGDLPPLEQVCAGTMHTVLRSRDGRVYAHKGYRSHKDTQQLRFTPADSERVVVTDIAMFGHTGFAVDSKGKLWSWDMQHHMPAPTPFSSLAALVHVVQVAAGQNHALAVGLRGDLWSWGSNECGQLGAGDCLERKNTPCCVLQAVISVSGGSVHSVAVTTDGALFAWGHRNYVGEVRLKLGFSSLKGLQGHPQLDTSVPGSGSSLNKHDKATKYVLAPARVDMLRSEWFVRVAAGQTYTIAATRGYKIYGFGPGAVPPGSETLGKKDWRAHACRQCNVDSKDLRPLGFSTEETCDWGTVVLPRLLSTMYQPL